MREYKVTMRYLDGSTRLVYIDASTPEHAVRVARELYAPRNIVEITAVPR